MFVMLGQSTDVVMNMNNAHEITDPSQAPELWHIVEDMALVGKVPMPRVFIIDDPSPNAFATGSDPNHLCRSGYDRVIGTIESRRDRGCDGT